MKDKPYHPVEIPDPNMACVFAHAVRGGQSLISKRYSKTDENTKIIYLDANNLYGFGMSRKLPVDDFRWEVEVLIQQALAELLKYLEELDKAGRGCFLMGDFHIPGEIHKLTHDYPFMPEKSCVPEAALFQSRGAKCKKQDEASITHVRSTCCRQCGTRRGT